MDAAPATLDPGPATAPAPLVGPLEARWLGRIAYRDAWALQHRLVAQRAAGEIPDQLLLLEHPAVLTLGRNADERHVRVPAAELAARGIELIRVERGGEVTYHGPGQLVAYPILALSRRGLLIRPLVRALEAAMVAACAAYGVEAGRREGHPGCWCDPDGPAPRKIGALGIRVERGVSYHGIALNVDPDLSAFDLIDPCGMPGVISTSVAVELRRRENSSGQDASAAGHSPSAADHSPSVADHSPSVADPSPSAADHSPSDAPTGITRQRLSPFSPLGDGHPSPDAPTGITTRSSSPDANVIRAAAVFARALADHLGADLHGLGASADGAVAGADTGARPNEA